MMKDIKISKNYAHALNEIAEGNVSELEEMLMIIKTLNSSISEVENADEIFNNPSISVDDRKALLSKLLSKAESDISRLKNFLFLLLDKQRFNVLPSIEIELSALIDEKKGIVHAEVSSAKELSEETLSRVRAKLEKTLLESGQQLLIENKIEPDLIGGIKIRVKDLVYDGTIRSRLENLRRKIR